MANISWNEIRHRALLFSREWQGAMREQAEKQSFWNAFFDVFGVPHHGICIYPGVQAAPVCGAGPGKPAGRGAHGDAA